MTITDSEISSENYGVYAKDSSDVEISGSTITVDGGSTYDGIGVVISGTGDLTITDSTITADGNNSKGVWGYTAEGDIELNNNDVTALTAVLSSGIGTPGTEIEIDGGTYTGGIQTGADTTLTINDGTFDGNIQTYGYSVVEINDGTFSKRIITNANSTVLIYDGEFTDSRPLTEYSTSSIEVSGGTFSVPVEPEFCAPDYVPESNGDDTYGVTTAPDCQVFMGAGADSSKIRADLYFSIPNGYDPAEFSVVFNGETTVLDTLTPDANGYKFSLYVPAKNMGDNIAYSLIFRGVTLKSGTVSIADYASNLKTYYPQYENFCNAMLAYGAAAQVYFGYNTDHLVSTADLTDLDEVSSDRFDADSLKAEMRQDDSIPVVYSAMSVTFLADTTLSIAFRCKNDADYESALEWFENNITLDGECDVSVLTTDAGYKYIVVKKQNIAIDQIETMLTLSIAGNEYYIGVMNYFASVEAAGSDNLKHLTRALYAYAQETANIIP